MEKFDPTNPEYESVYDLPKEQKGNFANTENGFVKKEAAEKFKIAETFAKVKKYSNRSFLDKIMGKNNTPETTKVETQEILDEMYKEAKTDDEKRTAEITVKPD